jgi:hypothetical protein
LGSKLSPGSADKEAPGGDSHCNSCQYFLSYVTGNSSHEQRWYAVSDLLYPFFEFPCEQKSIREGPEPLELGKGEAALLIPVDRPSHTQVAVHSPDGMSGFPRIKADGVESIAGDVLLRSADSDEAKTSYFGAKMRPFLSHFQAP